MKWRYLYRAESQPTPSVVTGTLLVAEEGGRGPETSLQNSDYNWNTEEILTRHFIKQTTIITRTR